VTADNAFKNIEKEVFEIENKIKENKNIIEQRIKEDEFEKNR
jgi:L-aspartate oxidase